MSHCLDKQMLLDWLFRIGIYRGTKITMPSKTVEVGFEDRGGAVSERIVLKISDSTDIGDWLLNDCNGPWTLGLYRPLEERRPFVRFARIGDAVIFRFKTA